MKTVLIIFLFLLNTHIIFANEKDSIFCFSKKEITVLANRVREVQDSVVYFRILGVKKDSLILLQDSAYSKAMLQLKNYKETTDIFRKREAEYKNVIKNMQPAWYENKFIWFGLGVLTTILISK
jgi:hypothetical protein